MKKRCGCGELLDKDCQGNLRCPACDDPCPCCDDGGMEYNDDDDNDDE